MPSRCRDGIVRLAGIFPKEQLEEFHTLGKGCHSDVFIYRVAAGALGRSHPDRSEADGIFPVWIMENQVYGTHRPEEKYRIEKCVFF